MPDHAPPPQLPAPWTTLFRAVGIALDFRKLILAALGMLLLALGWFAIGRAFGRPEPIGPWPSGRLIGADVPEWASRASILARAVADPVITLASPFGGIFAPESSWLDLARSLLKAFWGVLVWGLIGGAIARIAVLDLGQGERPGLFGALRFAARRAPALIGAPLSPLVGLAFFGLLGALFGLLYRIPWGVGASIAGVLAFLPLLFGLAMSLMLLGLAAGWPLMILTVAAEDEDAFDALSRSYSYVGQRPWRYLAYVVAAWGIGIVGLAFVWALANLVVQMAEWGMSFGAPGGILRRPHPPASGVGESFAATTHAFWLGVVDLLAFGWVYAYFWSAAAVVYLLMRLEVDGAGLDDVARAGEESTDFAPAPSPKTPPPPGMPNPDEGHAGPGPEGEGPP